MIYSMANNANCPDGFKRVWWKKIQRTLPCSCAIDEIGRMFTWGQNWVGNAGQGNPQYNSATLEFSRPELEDIELATQVGDRSNWLKASGGEYSTIALNELGELWGWGLADYDCSAFALPVGSGEGWQDWRGVASLPRYDYYFYTPARVAPNMLFKDVAHDYYHTLAIGLDDYLYVWGTNFDGCLGTGGILTTNAYPYTGLVSTPYKHNLLTAKVKLVTCGMLNSGAVTVDDRVYVWGDSWWDDEPGFNFNSFTPLEILGLTIPAGHTIIDCQVYYAGVMVLLSNGELWGAGSDDVYLDGSVSYPTGSQVFHRIDAFAGRFITSFNTDPMTDLTVCAIDSNGIAIGYEDSGDLYGNNQPFVWDTIAIMAAEFEDQRKFIDIRINYYNSNAMAIDDRGYLLTWGSQGWSSHLAIGVDYSVVYWQQVAQRAAPAVTSTGEKAYLNEIPDNKSEYIQPSPQLEEHDPCGHWHIQPFDRDLGWADEWPCNCWMTSLDVRSGVIFVVAAGRFLSDTDPDLGTPIIFMTYDTSTTGWTRVYIDYLKWSAEFPGGASFNGDVYGFYNYKATASGLRFNEVYTDLAMGVWVYHGGIMRYAEFSDSINMSGQNKFGVHSSGIVACAYTNTSGQIVLKTSTDFGATYPNTATIAYNALRKDYSLCVGDNGYIYLAHQVALDKVNLERSVDGGVTWATIKTNIITTALMLKVKLDCSGILLVLLSESATKFEFDRSLDGGFVWYSSSTWMRTGGTAVAACDYVSADPVIYTITKYVGWTTTVTEGANILIITDSAGNVIETILLDEYSTTTETEPIESVLWRFGSTYFGGAYDWIIPEIGDTSLADPNMDIKFTSEDATLEANGGLVAFAAYGFYTDANHPAIAVLVSEDNGLHWSVIATPLRYYEDWEKLIGSQKCNPIWEFEKDWNHVRSNWPETFVRQQDKY